MLKPFFQDKDSNRSGIVTISRFRSILNTLKLTFNDECSSIINKRFIVVAPNEVNYLEFDKLIKTWCKPTIHYQMSREVSLCTHGNIY